MTVLGTTTVAGTVQAVFASIVVNSAGTLNIGGTILNGQLTNNGLLTSSGVVEGGTLTNNNVFYLYGGNLDCEVINNGSMQIWGGTIKDLDNEGAIKTTNCQLNVTGTFTNNGTLYSDPADNYFHDVVITAKGALVGGKGDRFFVSGNLISQSTNRTGWNTAAAELVFKGGAVHVMDVNGRDMGATAAGYEDNFAWGTLSFADGERLVLQSDGPGGALYVQVLALPDGIQQISEIVGNGVNIYYDPTQPGNRYLYDLSYALDGGGYLIPDPYDPAAIRSLAAQSNYASFAGAGTTAVPLPGQAIPAAVLLAGIGAFTMIRRRRNCPPSHFH